MSDEDQDRQEQRAQRPFGGFQFEIDPERIEQTLQKLRERVNESFVAGRYTKVRLSYRGKAIGPDIPLAVFLAGEGVAFWLISPLAALLVNLGAKAILDVEFVHEADELVQEGLQLYLEGESEAAEKKYREALDRRPDDPSALYNLGTLLRVSGRKDEALQVLRKAAMGPEGHPDVKRAAEAVEKLMTPKKTL
ncbi:MAG: tetratricopeptide repeat protein [Alphaproteobacteria bacterium]|nr:tetratricopeptide repeat protein [Alphaproteobacteria bacterium]